MKAQTKNIHVEQYSSIHEISKEAWENGFELPFPLRYNSLVSIEKSEINQFKPFYLKFGDGTEDLGRANFYLTDTDFSTMDNSLTKVREKIKQMYPRFLTFKTLECGYYTMLGEGLFTKDIENVFPALVEKMDAISNENDADIQIIRDVPYERYDEYKKILMPLGFYPCMGFPKAVMDIRWNSIEEYLADLKHETRNYFKHVIELCKKFNIEYEYTKDYKKYIPQLHSLWEKVHQRAKEYSREILTSSYFGAAADFLPDNSEVLIFRHQNKVVAFGLYLFDEYTLYGLNCGVDSDFEYNKSAQLLRANDLFSLKRAIDLGKKHFDLGVTNYDPKIRMGLEARPLIYFIKHHKEKRFSQTLAIQVMESIKQPNNFSHRPFRESAHGIDLEKIAKELKENPSQDGDVFNKAYHYQKINKIRLSGLYNMYPEFCTAQKSSVLLGNQKIILLGTNSYLGAATHPDVIRAAKEAIDIYGTGCSGSPLLNGTLNIHNLLEKELAEFLGRDAVVLCSTGYQTNLAGITALCEYGDVIVLDERSHRSLFDAAKMSGATYYTYRHNDMEHLEKVLSRFQDQKILVVTDSVFSMEGILPDLKSISGLCKKYGVRLFVDEAHGIGVLGQNGRGACELLEVEKDVDLIMATFSKSFAAIGGFIAGDYEIIDFIKHKGSPHIFSASLPASVIATVRAVLKLIREKPEMRADILAKAKFMADSLDAMGYQSKYLGTQIVPVILGHETLTMAAAKKFMEEGVYVNPVFTPAVPESSSGFRTSYIANHEWDDLKKALKVFEKYSNILNRTEGVD